MQPTYGGRANLVLQCGTDWTRTFTYFSPGVVLSGVTATAAQGAVVIPITNNSGSSITFSVGALVSFGSDESLYEVKTGATIANGASGSISLTGGGIAYLVSAGVVTQFTPMDLTGYTARMQVRAEASSTGVPILSLTTGANGIVLGGAAGTITCSRTSAQLTEGVSGLDLSSINAPPQRISEDGADGGRISGFGKVGVFDIELINNAGIVERLLQGQVVFDSEVTRP